MIERRAFLKGFCSLIAAPFAIMPIMTGRKRPAKPDADPRATSFLFTIQGWEAAESAEREKADQRIVPLYLPSSWRSPWP